MAEVTRNTVLAVVEETTKNTPVAPSAATDYTALQDGFEFEPAFESLENSELQASIGMSAPILGVESPTCSFSHYFRASGTAGQAPDYNLLLESALGQETIAAAEYNTVASSTAGDSSTRAVIKVDSAEGATFERGEALLIQDGTNGYSIRNVHSISSDDLSLGFNLAAAPASGVNLGQAVLYKPVSSDSSYPPLSIWGYRGNGGAIELISGARVSEMSATFDAGALINADFSLQGLEYYFNPIQITSSNKYIDLTDDGGTVEIVLTEDTYKDPNELAAHIQTVGAAACAASGGDDFLCSYSSSTGKFTISTTTGTVFTLLWNTGTNTANGAHSTLGYSSAADDSGALTYTSDSALSWASPYTPSLDSQGPSSAKANEVMFGLFNEYACKAARSVTFSVNNEIVDVMSVCSTSGKSDNIASSREVSAEISLLLTRHEVDTFTRFRNNTTVSFAYNWGSKSGGDWVKGDCCNIYMPTCKIDSFKLSDQDGLVQLDITLKAFVDSGLDEVYVNFI